MHRHASPRQETLEIPQHPRPWVLAKESHPSLPMTQPSQDTRSSGRRVRPRPGREAGSLRRGELLTGASWVQPTTGPRTRRARRGGRKGQAPADWRGAGFVSKGTSK